MIIDSTSSGELLELLDPDLKEEIDYEFSRGREEELLKKLLKNLDEYISYLNSTLSPLSGLLEPLSGIFYQANLTPDIIDFWKPKRVRLHSIDNVYTFNDPVENAIRYSDDFDLTEWHEFAYDSEYVTDSTGDIDIAILIYEPDKYNRHPGHYASVDQSEERLSVDGEEWQSGGFTPLDGPIDSTTGGIEEPWTYDSPFGCDLCKIEIVADEDNFYSSVFSDDYTWISGDSFSNNTANNVFGRQTIVGIIDNILNCGFRFINVTVPKDALIIEAYIIFTAQMSASGGLCLGKISGNDVDDASVPANSAQADALVLTTSFVNWGPVQDIVNLNEFLSPDISPIIQEIVNRGGWSSGNNLQIIIKDNGSSPSLYSVRPSYSVEGAAGIYKPELFIRWKSL